MKDDGCTVEASLTEYLAPDIFILGQVPVSFKSLSPCVDGFRVFTEIILTFQGSDILSGGERNHQKQDPADSVSQQIHKLAQPLCNGACFFHNIQSLNRDSSVFASYNFTHTHCARPLRSAQRACLGLRGR